MNIEKLRSAFETIEDVLAEVPFSKMKLREEKAVYLGIKNMRNMVEAAIDTLSQSSEPSQKDVDKAKGVIASANKTAAQLLARMDRLGESAGDEVALLQHAVDTALKLQSDMLKKIK